MPLFDFLCTKGHRTSQLFLSRESCPDKAICWRKDCTEVARFVIAPVQFRIKGQEAPMDRARDIWEGTGYDGDGINPYDYEAKNIQVDMGHKAVRHQAKNRPPLSTIRETPDGPVIS